MKKIIILIIIIAVSICGVIYMCNKNNAAYTNNSSENVECNQAIVNTYLNNIKKASDEFYSDYYTKLPNVMYYTVNVKQITSDRSNSIITFTSYPYLGPHDTIGIDEITFIADYMGNVELKDFNHIISYHLPDNLKYLEKKLVPGKYE